MDKQQISNLLHIQQASRENRLVIFVGAGVSRNSGIPTWNELIESMKSELSGKLSCDMDAIKVSQLYKDSRGYKEYMDKIKEILLYNKAVPNHLHTSILSLNPCHIITTNYDDLIEQELNNQFLQYDIVREDKDIPQIVYPNVLVKMHGDYITNNIILTETDYYNYPHKFPLIRAFVQSVFASKLVLFVGFSFADLNLKMILNELQNILSENMQRAYLLSCEEPDFVTRQYFEKKGINILYFNEKEIDEIKGEGYKSNNLSGIGLLTDKILFAINHYSAIPKKELAEYLYSRITPYSQELRSLGEGLIYFFPNYRNINWYTNSKGLQTSLSYFRNLAKELDSNSKKRHFLANHRSIDLKTLLQAAWYNCLNEIDGLQILDSKFYSNINYYIPETTIDFIYKFDYPKTCDRIKLLRGKTIQYTVDDLELPFTLYLLGDYWEAYQIYLKLLPLYWNRQKYILYFICRYNIWAIQNGIKSEKAFDRSFNAEKELELAYIYELEDILNKLPLDREIKKIFQDLISYKYIGNHLIKTEDLKQKIFKQRKSAEKGGWSINSNIIILMSLYQRESIFSLANYIICDNSMYYKSICYNTAFGVLNSFATHPNNIFGEDIEGTKIKFLDSFMLRLLIFNIETHQLISILNDYDIITLSYNNSGIKYINTCLENISKYHYLFNDDALFYNPLSNFLMLISKSQIEEININDLYNVVLKYWRFSYQIGYQTINLLIKQYPPHEKEAKELISCILYNSYAPNSYIEGLLLLIETLKTRAIEFTDIRINEINQKEKATALSLLYPIIPTSLKNIVQKICLDNIDDFFNYIHFIFYNNIHNYSTERFNKLLKQEGNNINQHHCFILAEIRGNEDFYKLHKIIDDLSKDNDCMRFFLSPNNYSSPEKVEIDWILKFNHNERECFFKNEIYRRKLKEYLQTKTLSKDSRNHLIEFL